MKDLQEDSIEIIATALDAVAVGNLTWDEFNLAKHDRRYHPQGYKDGGVCKYRKDTPGSDIREYYENIGKGMSVNIIGKALVEDFGITPIFAEKYSDLFPDGGFNDATASWIRDCLKPLSFDIHERNLRCLFEVCKDIQKRFPQFRMKGPKVISWEAKEFVEQFRAMSELDERNPKRTNFMAFGDYYSPERVLVPRYHIIRHEIGHNLATEEISMQMKAYALEMGEKPFCELMRKRVSEYSTSDIEEAIAESFAIYTSPFYKSGGIPKGIEKIIAKMLRASEKGLAMDAQNTNLPRKGLAPLNGEYSFVVDIEGHEPHNAIRWFDNAEMKFIYFDSYEQRACHIMKQYGVPQNWIEAVCRAFPQEEWSVLAIQVFVHLYRGTSKSLDESIAGMKRFLLTGKK